MGLVLITAVAPAQGFSPSGNRLINPGAEDPTLTGWQHTSFSSVAYGSSTAYPQAAQPGFSGDGTRLFAAESGGATLTQTVDLADLASLIDAGGQQLAFGADLGAPAGSADTIRLTLHMLDGAGQLIGEPSVIGLPSDADRGGRTRTIPCGGGITTPPAGTRTARVTLDAIGSAGPNRAFADAVYLTSEAVGVPAIGERPAEGPGCRTLDPNPMPPVTPSPPGCEPLASGPLAPSPGACAPLTQRAQLFPAKLSVMRAQILRGQSVLDIVAPISARASGAVRVTLHAAGGVASMNVPVAAGARRVRVHRKISRSQARAGTGIATIDYPGSASTLPQQVRLRVARRSPELNADRPRLTGNQLTATGRVSRRARGSIRVQLTYSTAGRARTIELKTPIRNGRYGLARRLPDQVHREILARDGTLHSSTQYTGYGPARIAGAMRTHEVLGNR